MKRWLLRTDYENLSNELAQLDSIEIPAARQRVREALYIGEGYHDNAGYDVVWQEEQALLLRRSEIDTLLKNSQIVDPKLGHDVVEIGSLVTVYDVEAKETFIVQIGGSWVHNTKSTIRRVSSSSPLGAALLGRRLGENVEVVGSYGELFVYSVVKIGGDNDD